MAVVSSLLRALPVPGGTKVRLAEATSRRAKFSASQLSVPAIARMRAGFRMSLRMAAPAERIMYYSGTYDPWLTSAFKKILEPGDFALDGGANIGYFSLLAARCVGTAGAVHSFEPVPATFARLTENIQLNKYANITANCLALSAQAGVLEFEVPYEDTSHLSLDRLASVVHRGRGQLVTVQACTLDDYVARHGVGPIKLAKFDIEGGEVAAVRGMRETLRARGISYLICELNVPLLEQQGLPPSSLRDALGAYGYEAYYVERVGGRRRPVQVKFIPVAQMSQPDVFGEYLFVAPGLKPPRL